MVSYLMAPCRGAQPLQKTCLVSPATQVKADMSHLKDLADWAKDGNAYLIEHVRSPAKAAENWATSTRVKRQSSLIQLGSQTSRSILTLRVCYDDGPCTACSHDQLKADMEIVYATLYEASCTPGLMKPLLHATPLPYTPCSLWSWPGAPTGRNPSPYLQMRS